jgi:hypothetical protein
VLFGGAVIVVATGIKSVYDARAVTFATKSTKTI